MKMENKGKRLFMCVFGVLICGVSVGFFKRAAYGVDPFQAFMAGLNEMIPISFGTLYVIANVCLLLFSLVFDRHYIGIATLVNLFFLGYVAQYSLEFLNYLFPELQIFGRAVCLIIGIVVCCFSSSLYFTANLGVSTYDAISLIVSNTWKIGKFKYNRIISDFACVGIGSILYLLGGGKNLSASVGVGTIITAFFMGPLIDFFNVHISEPLLCGKKGK
jgi:uncharacterized membrane protein YczE